MTKFKKNDGAITVYISIILTIMLILTGVLVDGARARVAESQVQSAAEAGANSLLANYNNILKEWFGLMALSENNPSVLEEELLYYMNRNLMTELGGEKKNLGDSSWDYAKKFLGEEDKYEDVSFLDMYDYRVEGVKVVPIYNLAENEVLRSQIVDYMKYRAPEILGEEFLEKINVFKGYKKQSEVLSNKLEVDKSLDDVSKSLEDLAKSIEQVNNYNAKELKDKIKDYCKSISIKVVKEKEYKECKEKKKEAKEALDDHRDSEAYKEAKNALLLAAVTEGGIIDKAIMAKQIADLDEPYDERYDDAKDDAKEAKEEFDEAKKAATTDIDNIFKYIDSYIKNNEEASGLANKIKEDAVKIDKKIKDLKTKIDGDTSDFAEKMRQEIRKLEDQVSKESMEKLEKKFNENKKSLKDLETFLSDKNVDDIDDSLNIIKDYDKDDDELIYNQILDNVIKVKKLDTDYIKKYSKVTDKEFPIEKIKKSEQKVEDPRDASEDLIKGSDNPLKEIDAPKSHEDFKELLKTLPSGDVKVDSEEILKAFIGEDLEFVKKIIDPKGELELSDESDIEKMNFENDSNDSISGGLALLSKLIEFFEKGLESLRDEIYVDEYALGVFNNYLSTKDLKESSNTISQVDLRLRNRSDRKPYMYFENEIEYIIGGSDNEKLNTLNVMTKILLIRFTLNTLHVYLDPVKMKNVYSIASSIAAATGPFAALAVHLVAALIVMGWSMAESILDIKFLLQGESVPIFKTNGTWILSIKGGMNKLKDEITQKATETVKDLSKEVVGNGIDSLENTIKISMDSISETIDTKIDNTVEKVFEPIDNALKSADKAIVDNFSKFTENLEDEVLNVENEEMKKVIKLIYELAEDEYKSAKEDVQSKLTMPIDKAEEEIEQIKESIKNKITNEVSDIQDTIEKKLEEAKNSGKEKLNKYIDSFGNKSKNSTVGVNNIKASVLSFNYEDYLRLLLLTTNKTKKITRIQDLIQLQMIKMTENEDFRLSNCNTHVGIKVNVSMKYFFMSQAFVRKELKTEEKDRHNVYVMLFKGY